MTALESQEPATEEVDIVNRVYVYACVWESLEEKFRTESSCPKRTASEADREWEKGHFLKPGRGVVTAYRYNLTGIEWIISTSP